MFLLKCKRFGRLEARVQVGRLFDTCGHVWKQIQAFFLFLLIILVDNLSFNESLKTVCKCWCQLIKCFYCCTYRSNVQYTEQNLYFACTINVKWVYIWKTNGFVNILIVFILHANQFVVHFLTRDPVKVSPPALFLLKIWIPKLLSDVYGVEWI